ncbi:single-stranded DNA-binding protein, partial [Methylobacterium sp. WL19]
GDRGGDRGGEYGGGRSSGGERRPAAASSKPNYDLDDDIPF